jgi:hypothetical protein
MIAGPEGVATHGKEVSDYQKAVLHRLDFDEWVVAFDGDAREESDELADFLVDVGKKRVLVVPFEEVWEDPGNSWLKYPQEEWVQRTFLSRFGG